NVGKGPPCDIMGKSLPASFLENIENIYAQIRIIGLNLSFLPVARTLGVEDKTLIHNSLNLVLRQNRGIKKKIVDLIIDGLHKAILFDPFEILATAAPG